MRSGGQLREDIASVWSLMAEENYSQRKGIDFFMNCFIIAEVDVLS
jgi:hypothetical protein